MYPDVPPKLCKLSAHRHFDTPLSVGHAEGRVEAVRGREEGGAAQPRAEEAVGRAEPGAPGKATKGSTITFASPPGQW